MGRCLKRKAVAEVVEEDMQEHLDQQGCSNSWVGGCLKSKAVTEVMEKKASEHVDQQDCQN